MNFFQRGLVHVDRVFSAQALNRPATGLHANVEALCALRAELKSMEPQLADFGVPELPAVQRTSARDRIGKFTTLRWSSGYEVLFPGSVKFPEPRNEIVRARLYGDDPGRPTMVIVHGYMGGHLRFEPWLWPTAWLLEQGVNVAFLTLPHHGARMGARRLLPRFPSGSVKFTIDGFRQSVWDMRSLRAHLKREGASSVGVVGMSLGGYVAALGATVSPDWDYVVPYLPLTSIPLYLHQNALLPGTAREQEALYEVLDDVYEAVTPTSRSPLVPKDKMMVIAGRHDQVAPPTRARLIADHFDCDLHIFGGAHLLQLGRQRAFAEMMRSVVREGMSRAVQR